MKKTLLTMAMVIAMTLSTISMAVASSSLGNAATDRAAVDTYSNFTIVDTNNPANTIGTISEVEFYAEQAGTVYFLIVDSSNTKVTDISEPYTAEVPGVHTAPFVAGVGIGDNLAVYSQGAGVVSFDYDSEASPAWYTPNDYGLPFEGDVLSIEGSSARIYSMNATITPASAPTKDTCKDGGWEEFTDAPGPFKNQGQCVSHFARAK